VLGDRVPEPGLEPHVETRLDPRTAASNAPSFAPNAVVALSGRPTETPAYLSPACFNSRARSRVRRVPFVESTDAAVGGVCNQFQEVLADERLPAGEQEHRHPETRRGRR